MEREKNEKIYLESLGPRERIIATALDLFYRQGYDATTVNQIIDVSSTHKASFYRYFQDKEELGAIYLDWQGKTFNEGWQILMKKADTPKDFIHLWISLLKRQIRNHAYFGCPIAKFMSSSEIPVSSKNKANEVLQLWTTTLANYFERKKIEGFLGPSFASQKEAKRFLKIFQGNSQFFVMTDNAKYFDEMKEEMMEIIAYNMAENT
ncbi:TetR/AcrR family transcriptional regulator [Leptospira ognonensis]|uniref:TetR/AcrR family transcriptional regulator n=1 Tax=Leptospira ognonensis TaxID=2484945 RepID=A0A4R9K1Y7_9LEPT|nr:TetR/AcrR family transcriptional regulator [Leptospira ognonensis]TGL58196.1 TetR/AcrR family transcriptional regulator [Leptospira ognonensis]